MKSDRLKFCRSQRLLTLQSMNSASPEKPWQPPVKLQPTNSTECKTHQEVGVLISHKWNIIWSSGEASKPAWAGIPFLLQTMPTSFHWVLSQQEMGVKQNTHNQHESEWLSTPAELRTLWTFFFPYHSGNIRILQCADKLCKLLLKSKGIFLAPSEICMSGHTSRLNQIVL